MNKYKISYILNGKNECTYINAKDRNEAVTIWFNSLIPKQEYEFLSIELDWNLSQYK